MSKIEQRVKQKDAIQRYVYVIAIAAAVLVAGVTYSIPKNSHDRVIAAGKVSSESTETDASSKRVVAPNFSLTSTGGKTISLSEYKGKVVVLDFWATWCPPCKAEIPDYIKLYSEYRKRGFQMLGISVDQGGVNTVKTFMKKHGINYPVMLATDEVIAAYGGIRGIPTTFVIDKEGNIVEKFEGYRPASQFENLIHKLIRKK